MPYIVDEYRGAVAKAFAANREPLGMGLTVDDAKKVEKVLHIGSSFTDPGTDWNRFEAYDATGQVVAIRTRDGY
jgi:hypothetical protein